MGDVPILIGPGKRKTARKLFIVSLRTVPTSAHLRYSGFLCVVPPNTGIFLSGIYAEKSELSRCFCHQKRKLGSGFPA